MRSGSGERGLARLSYPFPAAGQLAVLSGVKLFRSVPGIKCDVSYIDNGFGR